MFVGCDGLSKHMTTETIRNMQNGGQKAKQKHESKIPEEDKGDNLF
jgi:hypothetical protein